MNLQHIFPLIFILAGSLLLLSCLSKKEVESNILNVQEFVLTYSDTIDTYLQGNLFVEQKNDSIDGYIYNRDNIVYDFVYSRQYQYFYIKDNDTSYIKLDKSDIDVFNIPSWEFTSIIDSFTIEHVILQTDAETLFFGSDYGQTVIKYEYVNNYGDIILDGERTGLIENHKNIWMHPPRLTLFKILELNPFPFVKTPYLSGNNYSYDLTLASYWGDKRWNIWEGEVISKSNYQIEGFENVTYRGTQFSCLKIKAQATSTLGNTFASFWFSSDLGFLRMEYINIDKSKLHFQLI